MAHTDPAATTVTFLGASETVTGSRFLVEGHGRRLLVDCGLFQGVKRLREMNWQRFPVAPSSIDAVLLTHAHIDHSGYLPALVRDGFGGDIWCTPATAALARIMLLDSAHLHEEDARTVNLRHSSRHSPALPLYTTADAERCLDRLRPTPALEEIAPAAGFTARFTPVGHILGAASIHLDDGDRSVSFTGDVGRPDDPIMWPPEPLPAADLIVTESTYGDRRHPSADPADELCEVVAHTLARGGILLIPVFAVGRAQSVLYLLSELRGAGRIPDVPVFLNSPMAVSTTELFFDFAGEHRLSAAQCERMRSGVTFVRSVEESMQLSARRGPLIILAASGMASGGRVLHHLEELAPNHRNTILFTGFQAAGTRGEAMVNGAQEVKVFGKMVPVRAQVASIDSLSAHADADELVDWLGRVPAAPSRVAVVHGEATAADVFRRRLRDDLGWTASVPGQGETLVI